MSPKNICRAGMLVALVVGVVGGGLLASSAARREAEANRCAAFGGTYVQTYDRGGVLGFGSSGYACLDAPLIPLHRRARYYRGGGERVAP